MSVAVALAFAGALIAAVGAGTLAAGLIRAPRSDMAAWSFVLLALAAALGAQTMGFALGFSSASLRTVMISGLLFAPLWTAWGLVELGGRSLPARFATRLATAALTVVPGVILAFDPLNATPPFGKGWPGEARYMVLPRTALTTIHVFAVALALLMMTLAAVRTRRDPAWWDVFVPVAAAGAAVLLTVSLGVTLPNVGYPLLTAAAGGAVWFAASRAERVPLNRIRGQHAAGPDDRGAGERRRGRRRRGQIPPDAAREPSGWGGDATRERVIGGPAAAHGGEGKLALAADGMPPGREPDMPAAVSLETPGARVTARLFGLIAIYTLLEGRGDEFDRLAERTVEAVRKNEPDTLLFIVHTVPKAPMQRIFYEVYRDRVAYAEHRRQPDVESFFAAHRPLVLATNVIELELQYARVSALPSFAAMFGRETGGDRR